MMDLNELIKDLRPNIVTPHMEEVMKANPAARGNIMARAILRGMIGQRGKMEPVDIMHGDGIHTVRFLDPEVLCEGPWAMYSLMLLSISYGEQCVVIESLYPEKKQLMAKAFAALFSHDAPHAAKKADDDVLSAVEDANAGIAMILAKLQAGGAAPLHADEVGRQRDAMRRLADSAAKRDRYRKGFERSQQAAKKGD